MPFRIQKTVDFRFFLRTKPGALRVVRAAIPPEEKDNRRNCAQDEDDGRPKPKKQRRQFERRIEKNPIPVTGHQIAADLSVALTNGDAIAKAVYDLRAALKRKMNWLGQNVESTLLPC